MFEICFTRRYSMGHRLYSLKGSPCVIPHGHNEYVKVTLVYDGDDALDGGSNMAASFRQMKKRWHDWIDGHVDHSLHLASRDPLLDYFREREPENLRYLLITPGDPTTEALAACMFAKISAFLAAEQNGMRCTRLEIEEPPTNTVVFSGDPDKALNMGQYDGPAIPWWKRADMSINDLDLP